MRLLTRKESYTIRQVEYIPVKGVKPLTSYKVIIDHERRVAPCTVHIYYREGKGFYRLQEPLLSEDVKARVQKAMSLFLEEVPPTPIAELDPSGYLEAELKRLGTFEGLSDDERAKVRYYIVRDILGYGPITPILRDPLVEDISCEGPLRPVRVWHSRYNRHDWLETNVLLKQEELDALLLRFSSRSGTSLSGARPILDSTLPEGHRVSGTWRNEVSSFGSSFTIRKFRARPYSLTELIHLGMLDYRLASYFWQLMEFKGFLMIVGPSATGKTTLLNSLATLLNPNWKVISIEDVREINLPHPGWKALHTRLGGAGGMGKVDLFELVKLSLRERPDYVLLGEARGEEVRVLFQSAATGHGCLTTFHANNERALQARLTQPPISVSSALLNLIDATILLVRDAREGTRYIYRVLEFDEGWRQVFRREGNGWTGNYGNRLSALAEAYGYDANTLIYELKRKEEFLQEMVRKEVFSYEKLSTYLRLFYAS
jgi:flagellar protein FlaI